MEDGGEGSSDVKDRIITRAGKVKAVACSLINGGDNKPATGSGGSDLSQRQTSQRPPISSAGTEYYQ